MSGITADGCWAPNADPSVSTQFVLRMRNNLFETLREQISMHEDMSKQRYFITKFENEDELVTLKFFCIFVILVFSGCLFRRSVN